MANTKKFCSHSDGYGRCDLLSDGETREYCVEGPCPHEEIAEYAPVVHGEWIYHECVSSCDGAISGYSCSICNAFVDEEIFDMDEFPKDFCGRCGAKMDVTDINVGGKGGEA